VRYFSEPAPLDSEARAFLQRGMALAMDWAAQGLVLPHVGQTIDSTVEAINAGLQSLKAGGGVVGKVAVIVDRDLARDQPMMRVPTTSTTTSDGCGRRRREKEKTQWLMSTTTRS
jgi:hypothetical protein